jgi:hypothetical protein
MHYTKILLPIMAVIALLSCEKEGYYWGTVSTQKNGSPWMAEIRATKSTISTSKINITINTLNENGEELEKLNFFKVPAAVGHYPLSFTFDQPPNDSLVGCLYFNGYLDQLYDSYWLSKQDSTSYLEITRYDSKNKEIEGRFNLILWPDIKGSWNAPDSIVFSNGVFHTKIRG